MTDLTDEKGIALADTGTAATAPPAPSLAKQILTIVANALVEIAKVMS